MKVSNNQANPVKTVAASTATKKRQTKRKGPGRPKGSTNVSTTDMKLSKAVSLTESIIKHWDKPNSSDKVLKYHNERAALLNDKRVAKKWMKFYNLNL